MEVYHGSNLIIDKPKIIVQNRNLDFGQGFYTTFNAKQAENFALKVTKLRKDGKPIVSVFSFDDAEYNALNVLKFDLPDENWLDFVCDNRQGSYNGKKYDCIYGPVANDDVYTTFAAYKDGVLTKKQALDGLKVKKLFNQILFASEKAISILKFVKSYEVSQMNDNKIIGLLELIVPQIIFEMEKVKKSLNFDDIYKFYNSKLYNELSDESTKIWHYSPLTLYNMYDEETKKGFYEYPEEI